MGANYLFLAFVLVCSLATVIALQCYKCGQYNDGVGSITPCINYTHMKLIECPSKDHQFCIKFISEGSTVKDCVPKCTQKEAWNTKTFCCDEDGCNSSFVTRSELLFTVGIVTIAMLVAH